MILRPHERFVYAGDVALRAPNGTPLPAVPQYMIVTVDEADPALIADARDDERFVMAALRFTDRQRAEDRFAALKAGRTPPTPETGTPLYIKESTAAINPKTHQTHEGEKIIKLLAQEFAELLAMHTRREKSVARQGNKVKEATT